MAKSVNDLPGGFTAWMDEFFRDDPTKDLFVCRRCGQRVGYLTKHAVVRHGDDIQIEPVTNTRQPEMADIY